MSMSGPESESGSAGRAMTPEIYERAMPWHEYLASMRMNRALLERKLDDFSLPPAEREHWEEAAVARALLFTEDSCQDSISALPPLLALRDAAGFELRVLRRSNALSLMRALTGEEFPAIPLVLFYDAEWRELGRFVEMPRAFRRLKEDPEEALWLREMYDELWWQSELEELAQLLDPPGSRRLE